MSPSSRSVALRHQARCVARRVAADLHRDRRASSKGVSREITSDTLTAFAEVFWLPATDQVNRTQYRQAAFGGGLRALAKGLKQLGAAFTKAPRLWEDFKRLVGIKSMKDLPGAIKDLAAKGKKALQKGLSRLFDTMPMRIYTLKGAGLNDLLAKIVQRVPGLESALGRIKGKADQLGEWLQKNIPVVSTAVIVAVFIFIWLNVVEFEWNLRDLTAAITGQITLGDLLASLPGSALGFLMNGLGLGTFTLLPATIVARVAWLWSKGYIKWTGRWFDLDVRALERDGFSVQSFA